MKSQLIHPAAVIALLFVSPSASAQACDEDSEYLGQFSANPFPTDSTSKCNH